MSYDPDLDSIRAFFRQISERPTVQLKFDVEVAPTEQTETSRLELESAFDRGELVDRPVQIRAESENGESVWVATARWTESGHMKVGDVRKIDVSGPVAVELSAKHRITLPPSSVATLETDEEVEPISTEPVDLSLGGVGLWAERELSIGAGASVKVSVTILGEFLAALPGTVAFVDRGEDGTRIGVMFDGLTDAQSSKLEVTLRSLMTETSYG